MASARYYKVQAQTLLGWALAASDSGLAAKLNARAMEFLALADQTDDRPAWNLNRAIEQFNNDQLRRS